MLSLFLLLCLAFPPGALAAPIAVVAPSTLVAPKQVDPGGAAERFAEAAQAAEAGRVAEAFRLAGETLALDPRHADARRVLGYVPADDGWTTRYGERMARRGLAWDDRFGWIKPADLPRYEAGERPLGSRWVSVEEDAKRHATIERGWQAQTDHWLVTTNDSPQAAAGLARELEALFDVWRALFADFNTDQRESSALFSGDRSPRAWRRPMKLVYHRNKEEYVAALKHLQPRIDETIGIYFDTTRESHFANLDEGGGKDGAALARGTLYHEATHQLFQECQPTAKEIGRGGNFWVTEGVALWMESLRGGEGRYTVGGPDGGRLPAARQRLAGGYYVPFAELAALGKRDLQLRTDLAPLYSQMAGLAAYFMEAEEGALRPAFVEHLRAVYNGEDDPYDLPRRLGRQSQEIDSGYRAWAESLSRGAGDVTLQGPDGVPDGSGAEPSR